MPSPRRRSRSGQAAADYVALLCLVAAVLAGAGVAVAGTDVPAALVRHLESALCVVGGDICLDSQARAAGLEPCVVADRSYASRWTATALFLTGSQEHSYLIEHRSDGRITVTSGHDRQAGGGVRVAARLGPAAAAADADVTAGWRSGMVWELDGPDALRRFLARAPRPHRLEHDADWRRAGLPPPTTRYLAGGAAIDLSVSLEGGVVLPLMASGGRTALGRRVGPAGTTWFFDVPKASAGLLGGAGSWSAELDGGRDGRVERLVLRSSSRSGGEEVELTRVVDLREPAAAAAARDLLVPSRAVAAARALGGMGRVQRDVYHVTGLDSSPDVELAAAIAGVGHADQKQQRRLIASTVTDPGGHVAARADCSRFVGSPR